MHGCCREEEFSVHSGKVPNPPNVLQQLFQNSLINLCIDSLTLWYKFILNHAIAAEKCDQHHLNPELCQHTFLGGGEDHAMSPDHIGSTKSHLL